MSATNTTLAESAPFSTLSNAEIAGRLDDVANLLEDQGANQYRVQAWRGGAASIRQVARPVGDLLREEGIEGLDRLPGIGPALARAVSELAETGRLRTLERLHGESDPVALLTLVPGIRDALATRLRARRPHPNPETAPSVAELLDVDREYRERAAAGELPTIAPRRFNPTGERWLPILHTTRGAQHYTALFSNTATAHRVGRTHDWVVIYLDGSDGERQCTVVTELKGPLAHRRVIRGRESECVTYYHLAARESAHRRPSRATSAAVAHTNA